MLHRLLRQWESPPTWLALFIILLWAQSQTLSLFPSVAWMRGLGAAAVLAGLGVVLLAAVQFRRHRTTILPREDAAALIDTGLFAFSRNPIYLGDSLILAGLALRWDLAGLLLVPVFMAVITRRFIIGEEASLRAKFGPIYDRYAAHVRRWI